jgi:hypothetical protein
MRRRLLILLVAAAAAAIIVPMTIASAAPPGHPYPSVSAPRDGCWLTVRQVTRVPKARTFITRTYLRCNEDTFVRAWTASTKADMLKGLDPVIGTTRYTGGFTIPARQLWYFDSNAVILPPCGGEGRRAVYGTSQVWLENNRKPLGVMGPVSNKC